MFRLAFHVFNENHKAKLIKRKNNNNIKRNSYFRPQTTSDGAQYVYVHGGMCSPIRTCSCFAYRRTPGNRHERVTARYQNDLNCVRQGDYGKSRTKGHYGKNGGRGK